MRHRLPALFSSLLTSVAVLMFLIAGASFNHSVGDAGHTHSQQHLAGGEHHHAQVDDHSRSDADLDAVHCGANLLSLVDEAGTQPILTLQSHDILSLRRAYSKPTTVDPPPPRKFS
ncbi:MAG: hypothetical protein ABJY83_08750 [Roseibium sp.]